MTDVLRNPPNYGGSNISPCGNGRDNWLAPGLSSTGAADKGSRARTHVSGRHVGPSGTAGDMRRVDSVTSPETDDQHERRDSVTKQALSEMGVPEDVAQLAIDVHNLRKDHQRPHAKALLHSLAFDILEQPSLKEEVTQELKAAAAAAAAAREAEFALRQELQGRPPPDKIQRREESSSSDIEDDGCEADGGEQRKLLETAEGTAARCPENEIAAGASEIKTKTKTKLLRRRVRELQTENRKLQSRKLCRMCREVALATDGITFLPCGHFITCEACSERCDDCPACGKSIMGTVRTFLS